MRNSFGLSLDMQSNLECNTEVKIIGHDIFHFKDKWFLDYCDCFCLKVPYKVGNEKLKLIFHSKQSKDDPNFLTILNFLMII